MQLMQIRNWQISNQMGPEFATCGPLSKFAVIGVFQYTLVRVLFCGQMTNFGGTYLANSLSANSLLPPTPTSALHLNKI